MHQINTNLIGSVENPQLKLPGSGGGADIACLAQRLVSLMEHDPRRFRERVDFVTSPGYGPGGAAWRTQQGLVRGGPVAVITTLAPHHHRAITAGYGHLHAGVAPKKLAGWLAAAGLAVSQCEITSREKRAPHFEVVTAFAHKALPPRASGKDAP